MNGRKLTYLAGGALAALTLISLMGPTGGGFPSRPRFQAVGINAAAPAQGRLTLNVPATSDVIEFQRIGTARGLVSVDSNGVGLFTDPAQTGAGLYFNTTTNAASFLGSAAVDFSVAPTIAGVADFARLSVSNTFTGAQQTLHSDNAILNLRDTNAPTDENYWSLQSANGTFFAFARNDALSASTTWLQVDRTGVTIDSAALTATTITAATGATTHSLTAGEQTISGGTNPQQRVVDGTLVVKLQGISGANALVGTESNHQFSIYTNNAERINVANGGTVNVLSTLTRAGNTVWDAGNDGAGSGLDADTLDGISSAGFIQTDAIGTTYVAYSSSVTSRTSDATNTCDSNLTLSLPNATRNYSLRAFLNFDGNGITANGWSILPQASTGTIVVDWHAWADTNTSTGNAAPTANQGASGGDMDATFNAAGVATYVTVEGVVRVTAGAAPAVCIAWGQTASNATATDLNIGSYMQLTRLN